MVVQKGGLDRIVDVIKRFNHLHGILGSACEALYYFPDQEVISKIGEEWLLAQVVELKGHVKFQIFAFNTLFADGLLYTT